MDPFPFHNLPVNSSNKGKINLSNRKEVPIPIVIPKIKSQNTGLVPNTRLFKSQERCNPKDRPEMIAGGKKKSPFLYSLNVFLEDNHMVKKGFNTVQILFVSNFLLLSINPLFR
jgi:hypothetical protein